VAHRYLLVQENEGRQRRHQDQEPAPAAEPHRVAGERRQTRKLDGQLEHVAGEIRDRGRDAVGREQRDDARQSVISS
jgi:hypothetical protein